MVNHLQERISSQIYILGFFHSFTLNLTHADFPGTVLVPPDKQSIKQESEGKEQKLIATLETPEEGEKVASLLWHFVLARHLGN